jgi:hypothetical protein
MCLGGGRERLNNKKGGAGSVILFKGGESDYRRRLGEGDNPKRATFSTALCPMVSGNWGIGLTMR